MNICGINEKLFELTEVNNVLVNGKSPIHLNDDLTISLINDSVSNDFINSLNLSNHQKLNKQDFLVSNTKLAKALNFYTDFDESLVF